jgi:hypothetical protein
VSERRNVCVFCGSSRGANPAFARAAADLGAALARDGLTLVYGGASVGLMGVIADAALTAGGRVIGVIPGVLMKKELAHTGLTELIVTTTMHDRKARMADLADAFVALPGSIGTLDELFDIWTWAQLGLHSKPCVLLNVDGYFDPLIAFLDRAQQQGFLKAPTRALLQVVPALRLPAATLFPSSAASATRAR